MDMLTLRRACYPTVCVPIAVGLLSACQFTPKVTTQTFPEIDRYKVKTVVVLPFDAIKTPQVAETVVVEPSTPAGIKRSDIEVVVPSGQRLDRPTQGIPEQAPERITRIVYGKLSIREGLTVYSPDDAAAAIKSLAGQDEPAKPAVRAGRIASKMAVDAALIGRVLVFQERKGNKLGGETAAVGFEIKLISADGTPLWAGNYYEKQKPLTEDAKGFAERGGVFVTADELAEYGATHLVDRFPFGARAKR
jgi:hypothetical protein